jgi:glucose/arabinose dehydrogenase
MVRTRKPLLAFLLALAAPTAFGAPPYLSGCPVFDRKNFWNTPVDTLQVHAQSNAWVTTIGMAAPTHPDFGAFDGTDPIGIPFITVPGNQPRVPMVFDEPDESEPGPYPYPPNAPIEGGPASDGDRHVLVLDRDNCVLYETGRSFPINGGTSWEAFSGAVWNFRQNVNRPQTWTSADAAGLPILPGLVRFQEFQAGEINHAIRFTAPQTRNTFLWPATHQASSNTGTQFPPMGARFRLKASKNISGFDPRIQVVLRAMKKYGIVLADNGSSWFFSGEHNPGWDNSLLNGLKQLTGADFEAVDTAPMRISTNSTQAFQPPPAITLREVATGLVGPLDIQNANDGSNRLFIVQQNGVIRILKNGALVAAPFFQRSVDTSGERGLLGLAFDPKFRTNRRFFVFYVPANGTGTLTVSSYLVQAGNPDLADMASERVIVEVPHLENNNHNGGKIAFGPDGYLYISTGDGGSGGDPNGNGQNLNTLLGKMLRLDVSGGGPGYVIPPTNPFAGGGGRGEIWAYGLRNPFRFSFDRHTGDLYIGDVGQDTTEEINWQPAGVPGGRNYGWKVFEGPNCYPPSVPTCTLPNHTPPVLSYGRALGNVVTGGNVYRGRKSRSLYGYYIYADQGSGRMWGAYREGANWGNFELMRTAVPASPGLSGPTAFGEDESGELYVASINNGRVFAIDAPVAPSIFPVNDLNSDGKSDLLFQNADGRIAAWTMNGTAITASTNLIGAAAGWSVTHTADLSGDAKADILFKHVDGRVYAYVMNGLSVAVGRELLGAGLGWSVSHTADLNGDGKADLILRHTDGRAHIWLMNGVDIIGSASLLPAASGWTVVNTGDLDGDGKSDIVFMNADGRGYVYLMNGTAIVGGTGFLSAGSGWTVSHVGDANGDGKTDLVFTHTDGRAFLWLMNGTTFTSGVELLPAGTGWSVSHLGDLNGDLNADVVFRNVDGRAHARLMNGTATITAADLLPAGTGWSVTQLFDLNGDGKMDLVFRNVDGRINVRLMDGLATTGSADLIGAGGWSVVPPQP